MLTTPIGHRIIVRFARKPIWMPTAPSKLFRIPEHTFYSPDEVKQIVILDNAYKAQQLSVANLMKEKFYLPAIKSGGMPDEFIKKEQIEEQERFKENDEENARVAKLRDEAFNKTIEQMESTLLKEKIRKEEELLDIGQKVDEYIVELLNDPKSFVTEDNIDTAIEEALANPVSFEYCIDRSGRTHKSRQVKTKTRIVNS